MTVYIGEGGVGGGAKSTAADKEKKVDKPKKSGEKKGKK